jgi:LytS/YehU family sensor histidine kinase
MQVQLKGLQDTPRSFDPDNPYDIFLFKDLPPGSYELIAWPYPDAPEEITLRYGFTILPPWWLGPWAIIGFTFAVTATLAGAIFGMYRVSQQRKTRELAWQQKITDAELKAIRAQLNPHFLFNTLSSIQNLVSTGLNEKANDYIIKLSRLLRIVLSSSENQFHDLEQEFDILRLYLELEKLRYGFSYSIEVDPEVDTNTLIPAMILQPYVENAVKHGVAGLGKTGEITVRAGIKNYALVIEILDNGPGMSKPGKDSAGLKLGDERLRSLNELYSADARVKIVGRTDQNGVRVVLTLPLNNEI